MCTVIYIPKENAFNFVSLRDENPGRPKAIQPEILNLEEQTVLTPIDTVGQGTWIGVSTLKNVVILLNGGKKNHTKKSTYLKSRGLIVKELLGSISPIIDWAMINLNDIEPFTLVVFSDEHLFELIWDGQEKHRQLLDKYKAHIWSSSTLYSDDKKTIRKEKFENWIAMNPPITKLSVLDFFKAYNDDENGFLINRNSKIKNVSYSFIDLNNSTAKYDYYDLLDYKHYSKEININIETCSIIK